MATPENTLITRAEVNSITNVDTGRKALVLDGTTIELGNTGLRDISGMFKAGAVSSGRITVRRVGSVVTWHFNAVQISASAVHPWDILPASDSLLPFAPEKNIYEGSMATATDTGRILIDAAGGVSIHYGEPSHAYTGVVTFNTSRGWPSTLPGVVDEQPVRI